MTETVEKLNVEELTESLTGFEEIAISKVFSVKDFMTLPGTMSVRALLFVVYKRDGDNDTDAYQKAMEMSMKAVQEFFDDDIEAIPDEPVTESGKGSESDDSERPVSLTGASELDSVLTSSTF